MMSKLNRVTFDRSGEHHTPWSIAYLSAHLAAPVVAPTFSYSGNVQASEPAPRYGRGVPVPGVALSHERYAAVFRNPSREREKELNRLYPAGYAPRSWFSKAVADKRPKADPRAMPGWEKLPPDKQEELVAAFELILMEDQVNAEVARSNQAGRREALKRGQTVQHGRATPEGGFYLTEAPEHNRCDPAQGVGLGLHVEGTPHLCVSNGMSGRGERGKSDLHANKHIEPIPGTLGLAARELQIRKWESQLADLRASGRNDRDWVRQIRAARHQLEQDAYELRTGGFMHRLEDFGNHAARGRTSRGRAAAEKVRNEKARH